MLLIFFFAVTLTFVFSKETSSIFSNTRASTSHNVHVTAGYKCETTGGSPWSSDVIETANCLAELGTTGCKQTNVFGSLCKSLMSGGTASIGICAAPGQWVECSNAGLMVKRLVKKCQANVDGGWRTGGYVVVDELRKRESFQIIVYDSGVDD